METAIFNLVLKRWLMDYKEIKKRFSDLRQKKLAKDKEEFQQLIHEIIHHENIQVMKNYNHHGHTSCYQHSLHVAYYNYKICKAFGWDVKAAARAGLMHDMFLYDWHEHTTGKGERKHGFEHPMKALKNAAASFDITQKEGDMIAKHMFPLTVTPPRYKETVVIILTDKFCSSCEVLDRFLKKDSFTGGKI